MPLRESLRRKNKNIVADFGKIKYNIEANIYTLSGKMKTDQQLLADIAVSIARAGPRRIAAQVEREKRRCLRNDQRVIQAPHRAEKNRVRSLAAYYKNRDRINVARQCKLDKHFRRAVARGEREINNQRVTFFNIIRRLENKIANRPAQRIKRVLRRRLQKAVSGNIPFSKTSRELLGCEVPYLKAHLESLWKPGMSWENYGYRGWHIDHVKPCAAFDLTNLQDQKECFHYTNLQPLWAAENFKKRDKLIDSNLGLGTPFAV